MSAVKRLLNESDQRIVEHALFLCACRHMAIAKLSTLKPTTKQDHIAVRNRVMSIFYKMLDKKLKVV